MKHLVLKGISPLFYRFSKTRTALASGTPPIGVTSSVSERKAASFLAAPSRGFGGVGSLGQVLPQSTTLPLIPPTLSPSFS